MIIFVFKFKQILKMDHDLNNLILFDDYFNISNDLLLFIVKITTFNSVYNLLDSEFENLIEIDFVKEKTRIHILDLVIFIEKFCVDINFFNQLLLICLKYKFKPSYKNNYDEKIKLGIKKKDKNFQLADKAMMKNLENRDQIEFENIREKTLPDLLKENKEKSLRRFKSNSKVFMEYVDNNYTDKVKEEVLLNIYKPFKLNSKSITPSYKSSERKYLRKPETVQRCQVKQNHQLCSVNSSSTDTWKYPLFKQGYCLTNITPSISETSSIDEPNEFTSELQHAHFQNRQLNSSFDTNGYSDFSKPQSLHNLTTLNQTSFGLENKHLNNKLNLDDVSKDDNKPQTKLHSSQNSKAPETTRFGFKDRSESNKPFKLQFDSCQSSPHPGSSSKIMEKVNLFSRQTKSAFLLKKK